MDGELHPTANDHVALLHAATDALVAANPETCFATGKDLMRYTAAHREERDKDTLPQPAHQLHHGRQGRESIGLSWAEGFRGLLPP